MCTEVYMSPNKCSYAREKYLLKVLAVKVLIETSPRLPPTIGCFVCCIYQCNHNGNSKKGSRAFSF